MSAAPPPVPDLVRVAVVEDDRRTRESLAVLIDGTPGYRCVGAYADAESALECLPIQCPHVVLMDIHLRRLSGVECVRRLKPLLPATQVLMLTVFEDEERIFEALTAGATGYMTKRAAPAEILAAIAEVHQGGSPMSSAIARKVVQAFQQVRQAPRPSGLTLSPREAELLGLLARGLRYKEIADQMHIALDTVRSHIRRIYEKLQVTSRTEAVVKFLDR